MLMLHSCLLRNKHIAIEVDNNQLIFHGFVDSNSNSNSAINNSSSSYSNSSSSYSNSNTFNIDLHGLTKDYVRTLVPSVLEYIYSKIRDIKSTSPLLSSSLSSSKVTLNFITGQGLHSKGFPVLGQLVMKLLEERGMKYDVRKGMIVTAIGIDNHDNNSDNYNNDNNMKASYSDLF